MYRERDQDIEAQLSDSENQPGNRPHRSDAAGRGADSEEGAQPAAAVKPARRAMSRLPALNKRTAIAAAVAIAVAAGGFTGVHWWVSGRFMVSTDDAYVGAHNTTLASKISGYVASIPIEDNTPVRAGDVIATIDDGDYKLAVDAAREKVATQQA